MPVISIEIGQVSPEIKADLIKNLTECAAGITHIPKESFIVLINEYPRNAIGVGGTPLSERI